MKEQKPSPPPEAADLTRVLREKERKITGPRRAILAALERQSHPVTIRELHAVVGGARCDLATIYRAMRMLEQLRQVQRYDFGDGSARFELVRQHGNGHHHHLICTACSRVVEIEECFPTELEEKIAAGNGFSRVTHKLEFFGVCSECEPNDRHCSAAKTSHAR